MAKASDNSFPKVIVTEGSTPASPSAGSQKLFIDSADHHLKRVNSSGTVTDLENSTATVLGAVIAVNSYTPGTLGNFSTSSTTSVDMDATNMAVTFTAPSTGKVLIRLTGISTTNNAAGQHWWTLRESTTVLAGALVSDGTGLGFRVAEFVLTGLSAGSHTYKWAHYVSNAAHSGTTYVGGTLGATSNSVGPATMTVISLA